MRQQQELLRGTVNAVVFYNAENGYCVLRLQCEDGELTNVVGMIPMPVVGERLLIGKAYRDAQAAQYDQGAADEGATPDAPAAPEDVGSGAPEA